MPMVTKDASKNLRDPARTVYIDDELWGWLKKFAETSNGGRPESTASLVRKILDGFRAANIKRK